MYIYKKEILAAMKSQGGFEIIQDNEDGENLQGSVLARWKGLTFFLSFNDKLALNIKNNSDSDDERIYRATAFDFQITFVMSPKELNGDKESKYKIANYANMVTDLGAVYIYREDADLFEIPVRNTGVIRQNTEAHVGAAIIRMILTGTLAVQELTELLKSYINSPEAFLEKCKGNS